MRDVRKLLLILFLGIVSAALADTIVLKNGRTIVADSVTEKGDRIIYEIGDDEYGIPKSAVDHIDKGGATPVRGGGAVAKDTATVKVVDAPKPDPELQGQIIRNGHVDESMLDTIAKDSPERATAAYVIAAFYERDAETSRRFLERAASFSPDNVIVAVYYAESLINVGRFKEAADVAGRATRLDANSADAWGVLGLAYYRQDKLPDAITALKRSLELRPSKMLSGYLARAEREQENEGNFGEQGSTHFNLRYQGEQSSPALRAEILRVLESDYDDLVRDLGAEPRESISVVLYTNEAYFDVTRAPSWTAALNDGRLRIPVQGLTSVSSELAHVLKHELTHSFVAQITHNRCPTWLNEGLAMIEEGRTAAQYHPLFAKLYSAKKEVPLYVLSGSFMGMSDAQAQIAYAESLGAVEYIRDTYGLSDVERILERIGEGQSAESALRDTIHTGYEALEDDLAQYYSK